MTYEEKREFHKIISQILADEGLNRGRIKEIVEEEIRKKVDQVIKQKLSSLDAETTSRYGQGYIENMINNYLKYDSNIYHRINDIITHELENRIIEIKFSDSVVSKEN